jgi:hypothetical protein
MSTNGLTPRPSGKGWVWRSLRSMEPSAFHVQWAHSNHDLSLASIYCSVYILIYTFVTLYSDIFLGRTRSILCLWASITQNWVPKPPPVDT